MQVRKAVITAAGRGAQQYPVFDTVQRAMLPLVDRDGIAKPVIQIVAEEALDSGIEEICIVIAPGDEERYRSHFASLRQTLPQQQEGSAANEECHRLEDLERRLVFAVQETPEGYGHAVWCAREFVGGDPFLLLVSDHLYISGEKRRCARQVIDLSVAEECSVAAVQSTREHLIHQYGTVAGRRVLGSAGVFQIEDVVEKPTPTVAEQRLHVPGLRVGHYLCLFGIHVLRPTIFTILDEQIKEDRREAGGFGLTPALLELARQERYLATLTNGRRHNVGVKYGSLEAQLALAMAGVDRDEVLAHLMEMMVQSALRGDGVRPEAQGRA